jgi:hypothetical protein
LPSPSTGMITNVEASRLQAIANLKVDDYDLVDWGT